MLIKRPKEFAFSNFGFKHFEPSDFVKSQWQNGFKSRKYVIYRWLVAILFITNITLSLDDNKNAREWKIWAIYLTRWGLILNVFTTFLAATLVTLQNYNELFQKNMNETKRLPIGIKIYWALHSVIVTLAILITIVYWGNVHEYGTPISIVNILNHIVNSVILIIDLLVVRHPHRLFHLIYAQLLLLVFAIFSFIYYHAGGLNAVFQHAIYPILDWTKTGLTLINLFVILIVVAVLHTFVHGIYRFRVWIHQRSLNNDFENNNITMLTITPKESVTIEVDNYAFNQHM